MEGAGSGLVTQRCLALACSRGGHWLRLAPAEFAGLGPALMDVASLYLVTQRLLVQICFPVGHLLGPAPTEVAGSGLSHRGHWLRPLPSELALSYLLM